MSKLQIIGAVENRKLSEMYGGELHFLLITYFEFLNLNSFRKALSLHLILDSFNHLKSFIGVSFDSSV